MVGAVRRRFDPVGQLQSVLTISATSVIAAPIAVAMHRFILLGEVSRSPVSIASGRTLKFFLWVASIQLIISTINEISTWLFVSNYLPFHSLAEFGLVMLAVAVPLGAATIYLALLFPALAIDEPAVGARARISTSMTRMQGHFWQFVGAILLTCAPITILGAVTNAFIGELLAARMTRPVVQGLIAGKRLLWLFQMQDGWFYVEHFLRALVTVLTVALAASVASWLYASILKGPKRNDT